MEYIVQGLVVYMKASTAMFFLFFFLNISTKIQKVNFHLTLIFKRNYVLAI